MAMLLVFLIIRVCIQLIFSNKTSVSYLVPSLVFIFPSYSAPALLSWPIDLSCLFFSFLVHVPVGKHLKHILFLLLLSYPSSTHCRRITLWLDCHTVCHQVPYLVYKGTSVMMRSGIIAGHKKIMQHWICDLLGNTTNQDRYHDIKRLYPWLFI